MNEILISILSAAFVGIITYIMTIRSIRARHIIEERQKWRDSLKQKIAEFFCKGENNSNVDIISFIRVNLNPFDEKDNNLYNLMKEYSKNKKEETKEIILKLFNELMKLDWEKSKIEASFLPFKSKKRAKEKCIKQKKYLDDNKNNT